MGKLLTAKEVAKRWGVTPQWVRFICSDGRLKAERVGRDWVIDEADVELYEHLNNQQSSSGQPPADRR